MGRSHPRAFDRVAGKTGRFSRNRCPRKRIGQFPAFDAHLLSDFWYSVSGADRIYFARDPARSQCRLRHHRLHSRERRKILSLSANDPFSELEIALSQLRESTSSNRALPIGDAYLAVDFRILLSALQHWIGVLSLLMSGAASLENRNCQK
jgi:hypothetical protein